MMLPLISINKLRHMNAQFKAFSTKVSTDQLLGSGTIDKLEILTNNYDSDYLKKYWHPNGRTQNPKWSSVRNFISKDELKSISILSNPGSMKPFFDKWYTYKISLNPTMFQSFKNLSTTLNHLLDLSPSEHKVYRSDFASVLSLDYFPVSSLHEYLYYPYKQKQVTYKSDDIEYSEGDYSGFRFGQNPECLSCYNVELKLRKMRQNESKFKHRSKINIKIIDHKTTLTSFKDRIINLELQYSGEKLHKHGIRHFSDLSLLTQLEPFNNFLFRDFYKIEYQGKKNAEELLKLILLMKTRGYSSGRKFYDGQNNFHRYDKLIPELVLGRDQVTMNYVLNKSFKIGMERFFK